MSKMKLKNKFIKLRGEFYTYDEIIKEIKISKPTAIKWGKDLKKEIELERIKNASDFLTGRIEEHQDTLSIYIEQFRRATENDYSEKIIKRSSRRMFDNISNFIRSKLISINLIMNRETTLVAQAVLLFNKEFRISLEGEKLDPFLLSIFTRNNTGFEKSKLNHKSKSNTKSKMNSNTFSSFNFTQNKPIIKKI